jgi:hypothetical protein
MSATDTTELFEERRERNIARPRPALNRDFPHIFMDGNPTRHNSLYPNHVDHFNIPGGSIAQIIKNALKSNIYDSLSTHE